MYLLRFFLLTVVILQGVVYCAEPIAMSSSSQESSLGRKRKERDEDQEQATNLFLASRALLIGKIQVIIKELKNLAYLSNNKYVSNFTGNLIEDTEKLNISDTEELLEKLSDISNKLNQIKSIKGIMDNDVKKINEVQAKIKSLKAVYLKNIDLSKLKSNEEEQKSSSKDSDNKENIDINDTEAFTQELFIDLIKTQQKKNLPYILARVETNEGIHYFDAHNLNNYMFNKYPIYPNQGKWGVRDYNILHKKSGDQGFMVVEDILNRSPLIIDDIHYFTLDSLKDSEFKYLSSFNDLITNKNLQNQFYLNSMLTEFMESIQVPEAGSIFKSGNLQPPLSLNLQTQMVDTLLNDKNIASISLSHDNTLLAAIDNDGQIILMDLVNNQTTTLNFLLTNQKKYHSKIKISKNKRYLVASDYFSMLIYDLQTKQYKIIKPLEKTYINEIRKGFYNFTISEDEKYIATSESASSLNIYSLPSGKLLKKDLSAYFDISEMAFLNNILLASEEGGNNILVFNSRNGQLYNFFELEMDSLYSLQISYINKYLLLSLRKTLNGDDYSYIELYDLQPTNIKNNPFNLKLNKSFYLGKNISDSGENYFRSIISNDEKFILSYNLDSNEVLLLDTQSGNILSSFKTNQKINAALISSNNQLINIYIATERGIEVWQLNLQ